MIVRQTSCSIPFLHFISATEFVQVSLSCKVDWATMFICFARRQFLSPQDRQLVRSDVQSRTSAGAECLSFSQRCLTCRVLFSSACPIHGSSFHVQTIMCQLDVVLSFTCQFKTCIMKIITVAADILVASHLLACLVTMVEHRSVGRCNGRRE